MPRTLAASTVKRLKKRLVAEREQLDVVIREIDEDREEIRLSETSSERSPDPNTAEGGSLVFEMEKELSIAQNARDLLDKVDQALEAIEAGTYGICDDCGEAIPVARLDALPYATRCVECAASR